MDTNSNQYPVQGAGIGLRRSLLDEFIQYDPIPVDFMEVAPENWIGLGGRFGKQFRFFTERYPFNLHGLSLSIGGPEPLDLTFIKQVKQFMKEHDVRCYSEHLSYCSDDGHLYDLMPIPFTEEAVHYVADRIKQVQDIIEQQLVIENVSYYAAPGKEMNEIDFINAILDEADCRLLLDVNNIYVNSVNHRYDAAEFLRSLPGERISYVHIAGHYNEADDLIVDTHGADVIDPVWTLLDVAYQHFGVLPTLLERDFNIPPYKELMREIRQIRKHQQQYEKTADSEACHVTA
ncbi:MAG: DUF692 domain-containing protein [Gammaproteobacteria bacterium]|nr:MAG: DUF692 domain-containing protein [Gammaproteobacteria bacterium]